MIRREEPEATWLISQGAHATIAGQIAAHWVGQGGMVVSPREELLLAANFHDAGWVEADQRPRITGGGLPRNFTEMDLDQHFEIWQASIDRVFAHNRYAALLTSMHCTALYDMRLRFLDDPEPDRERIRAFISTWGTWQSELVAKLHDHPRYGAEVQTDQLATNVRLLQVWDYLSLMLCMSAVHEQVLDDVPLRNDCYRGDLRLTAGGARVMLLDPFPLDQPLTLWADARTLPVGTTFGDDEALRDHFNRTPYKPLMFEIGPITA